VTLTQRLMKNAGCNRKMMPQAPAMLRLDIEINPVEPTMPLRFQRRVRISRGVSLNFNKRSISASFGRRGAHITVAPRGRRTTIGLPGTGLSYTCYQRYQPGIILIIVIVAVVLMAILFR
jgi:hypothetical protein